MSDAIHPHDEDDLLAAELALGVPDARDRAALAARRERDAAFDRLVSAWEERLNPLIDTADAVEARAAVWAEIERRLGAETVVPLRPARPAFWNNPAPWRWISLGTSALAAACLALLLVATPPSAPAMPMVAKLASAEGKPMYMAMVDARTQTVMVMAMDSGSGGPAAVPELWFIEDGAAPQSLGTFAGDGMHRMPISDDHMPRVHQGVMLAVSMEPPGGSPTGAPTGPVVATGSILSL